MPATASNPLHDLHRQAQAEFQNWGDLEIVSTFGEPQAEYAAIRKSAGLMDLPQRAVLELTGRDRLSFLNNILSAPTWDKQTKQGLPPGRSLYSFLLNLRGRIVADMNVLELGDRTLLELDHALAEPLRGLLEAYLFSEQVKISNRGDMHEIVLHGPKALEILNELSGHPVPLGQPGMVASIQLAGHEMIAWRDDPSGSPGVHVIVPTVACRKIWMQLITRFADSGTGNQRRLRPIGWAVFNTARIEAGRPIFGIDIEAIPIATAMPSKQAREAAEAQEAGPGMLPAETGLLEKAVSLTKCYVGQEIVARMHARGQVARKIIGIRMESDALPIAGAQILDDQSNPVGVVTSSTNSPLLSNLAICLGIVKRPLFEVGSELKVPAEGQLRRGKVVSTPFT